MGQNEGRKSVTPEMLCKNQTEMMCQWYPPAIAHSLYSNQDAYIADLENFTVPFSCVLQRVGIDASSNENGLACAVLELSLVRR